MIPALVIPLLKVNGRQTPIVSVYTLQAPPSHAQARQFTLVDTKTVSFPICTHATCNSSCLQFGPGLGSAGSMLMLLHVSLGCLFPKDPSSKLLIFESNKQCHCVSLLRDAAGPKSSLAEMSLTFSQLNFAKPSSLPSSLMF